MEETNMSTTPKKNYHKAEIDTGPTLSPRRICEAKKKKKRQKERKKLEMPAHG
jgi:hypothetical protein